MCVCGCVIPTTLTTPSTHTHTHTHTPTSNPSRKKKLKPSQCIFTLPFNRRCLPEPRTLILLFLFPRTLLILNTPSKKQIPNATFFSVVCHKTPQNGSQGRKEGRKRMVETRKRRRRGKWKRRRRRRRREATTVTLLSDVH